MPDAVDAPPVAVKPRKYRISTRLRQTWRRVTREQATPLRLGIAMGVGVFWGAGPFYGLQTILGMITSVVMRLNKVAVLLGLQVSTPPMTAVLILAGVQTGHQLMYGTWAPISMQMVIDTPAKELFSHFAWAFVLGGNLFAAALGVVAGFITTAVVKRQRAKELREPPLQDAEVDELFEKLPTLPRKFRHYGAWKVRLDPLYQLVLPLLSGRREVVDLGAGMGILAFLLRVRSPDTLVRAIEWDAQKADIARKLNVGDEKVVVETLDGRTADLGKPDTVCLFDVLHYSPIEEQRAWLLKVAESLTSGGLLLIRELDVERARWRMSERIEQQAVKRGWNQGNGVVAWPLSDMRAYLEELGFTVELVPAGKGLFSANALVVARLP